VAGVALGTEVSRRFGAVRHAIAPRVEWRAGTAAQGSPLPVPAYDAFDRSAALLSSSGAPSLSAAPSGVWRQLRAAVETRLARDGADLARLELGQDADLRRGRFGETFAAASASVGRVAAGASARFLALDGRGIEGEPVPVVRSRLLDRFTELAATLSMSDRRGDSLGVGFFSVGPGGSGVLGAGLDPLFDLRPAATQPAAFGTVGARVVLGGATLGYDATLHGRDALVAPCTAGDPRPVSAGEVQQHAASFVWDSPCRCFRVLAQVRVNDCARSLGDVQYSASIDLSRLAAARQAP
jgi:LPS-assembly protein